MDDSRFDALTRALGAARSRRSVLGALAGAAVAALGFDSAGAASRKRAVGNACVGNGDCASGFCAAESHSRKICHCRTAGDCPTPPGQCHLAACLPIGLCGVAVTTGAPCDDGNACTANDRCQADGTCAGTAIGCPTPDQCHLPGTCNPRTGVCTNPSKPNGSPCDDGDACTQTDTCRGGVCVGGNPVVCQPLDQCHLAGACNPATGVCSNPNATDGASCNDGDACTQTDTCQGGVCVGANPVVCPDPDVCHQPGTCNSGTGACDYLAKADGALCGADNPCSHDICQAGSCAANTPKAQGTACNDANACTQTDACDGSGACIGGDPVLCVAPDVCHAQGTCDPNSGNCAHDLLANWCFIGGVCYAADAANPANQCQACRPALSASAFSNVDDATPCDDGNACTQTDTCQAGVCVGSNPIVCTAQDQCHLAGACDPATGRCSNPDKPNGAACDDGNACTVGDACQGGVCTGGAARACDDNNACTSDSCDPRTGCVFTPISCNDNNPCTVDTCDVRAGCVHTPIVCQPLDQCHAAGTCNPATGQCSNPAAADGTSCNDGNPCTTNDQCHAGVCQGAAVTCQANAACNPSTGQCVCNSGLTNCNGACVNTQTDVNNCGSCSRACNSANGTATCVGGSCGIVCHSGFGNCDNNAANGCETNLTNDSSNCGYCGNYCQYGSCQSSTCPPCVPQIGACGTKTCGTAINNCGQVVGCGTCAAGSNCISGTCIAPVSCDQSNCPDIVGPDGYHTPRYCRLSPSNAICCCTGINQVCTSTGCH